MHRRYEPSNIPIEILRSFVSVLDTGSFTKAAARLNITQPAISAQIKRMQTLVGEELFRKEGAGISLTERGEAVCRYARRILALNDQILWSGRSNKRFRIGLPSILGGQHLGPLKAALDAENFRSVQIVCDRSDQLLKRVSSGLFDAVVAFSASDTEEVAPAIEWQEPLAWICHPEFVLSPGAPLPLLTWTDAVTDMIAVRTCERAQVSYTSEFVGDQIAAHIEALQLKLGYLCVAERTTPAGMKIAKDYFLPKLPTMHAGIYKNTDAPDARLDALVKCLARVFAPAQSTKSATPPLAPALEAAPGGPTTSAQRSRDPQLRQVTVAERASDSGTEARRYRDKANEARQLAELADTSARRDSLLNIASNYERTAQHLEVLSNSQFLPPGS
ncbi:LysR family transcriptional regulator [Bradyrhizobium sp.]|uniref:LysR family transcriptional regulator n=1 Tax=Bradyrhizobium sp. TaxID=376 RepID=UPI0039E2CB13